jgi:hypothetical protein
MKNELKITETWYCGVKEAREDALKQKERIENAEEVKRNEEDGLRLMKGSNGATFISPIEPPTYDEWLYWYAVKCDSEFNEENIEKAKEMVLDKICEIVRDVANSFPDKFFIIKNSETTKVVNMETGVVKENKVDFDNYFTVGCKLKLPFDLGEDKND